MLTGIFAGAITLPLLSKSGWLSKTAIGRLFFLPASNVTAEGKLIVIAENCGIVTS